MTSDCEIGFCGQTAGSGGLCFYHSKVKSGIMAPAAQTARQQERQATMDNQQYCKVCRQLIFKNARGWWRHATQSGEKAEKKNPHKIRPSKELVK